MLLLGLTNRWMKVSKRLAPHASPALLRAKCGYRLIVFIALVSLSACFGFGPRGMKYDIQKYNQATLDSETNMLLYNVGLLSQYQPPHFMMLASVSQTRTFSAAAGKFFRTCTNFTKSH